MIHRYRLLAFFVVLTVALPSIVHADLFGLAPPFLASAKKASGGGSYTGPGDIVSGWAAWGGLRAFSAAVAATGTQKSVTVQRTSDSTTADILILTNGNLDVATASTFANTDASGTASITGTLLSLSGGSLGDSITGSGVATGTYIIAGISGAWTVNISQTVGPVAMTAKSGLFITKLYDQSGHGLDWTAGANTVPGPLLRLADAPSGGPTMAWINVDQPILTTAGNTTNNAQPNTISAVFIINNSSGNQQNIVAVDGAQMLLEYNNTTTLQAYAGSAAFPSSTFNTWNAVQMIYNGSSSISYINGTQTTGLNTGGNGTGTNTISIGGRGSAGSTGLRDGDVSEAGLLLGTMSSGVQASMNSNQRTYWGF